MKQYRPSSEVDFVVIGSGAGGGIMAKQLSLAGFSVVVLEQGGWGKYGREHEYNVRVRTQTVADRLEFAYLCRLTQCFLQISFNRACKIGVIGE